MIKITFTGHIGKGARVIEHKNGNFMAMDVATDIFSHGEKKTMWIRVYSRDPKHINLAQYLTQGKGVDIAGEQQEPREWEDKEGKKHLQVIVVAKSIDFLPYGGKRKEGKEGSASQDAQSIPPKSVVDSTPFPAPEEKEDYLPF